MRKTEGKERKRYRTDEEKDREFKLWASKLLQH